MEITCVKMSAITLFVVVIATLIGQSEEIAVMSIDIGSEWMKVAIVSPGVPMEIALNKESKRKTPATIAFRDGERTFGEDAQVVGLRFPQSTFSYILDLLGKSIDNPMVKLYSKRFPYHDIIADDERQTIAFKLYENITHTPEELLAQILHKGKEFAEFSAGQKVNEAVITVPGYFNQAERRALLQAAELAKIKVLQLINDYTAVALNYGIFRRKEINDSVQYVMFYDMGASSTTATVVSYQNVKTKEKGFVETNPHVNILGVGYDRTLGGLEMQIRLQNYLAKEFDALNKTPNSVFNSPRAMAKLFKEAGRVKNVLSANADHYAQIEGLIDDYDFRLQVTRETFENICSDLFERVSNPVKIALETSALTMDVISQVILVGAGTRMPKIQEKLMEYVKTDLSKNMNTDESAALGAVYKAADLSQGFKVKKFITKDAVLFPIQIVFDRNADGKIKQVRRTLFNKMNAYPQKKIITFNKHNEDFEFHVNYAELDHLPVNEIDAIGNLNLSTIKLTGVAEALEKHSKEGAESKGIKAHFNLDDSGLLNLINIELVSEKTGSTAEEEEGTFSMLGSTISKLFAGSDNKEKDETTEEPPKENIKPVHEESEYPDSQKETEDKSQSKNQTKLNEGKAGNKTEKSEKEKKPVIVTIKEPIKAEEIILGSKTLDEKKFSESIEKIHHLDQHDREKTRRETALNNLEAFVIDAQQKLETEFYIAAATSGEAEKILKACAEISEWLYEDGFEATAEIYEEKLMQLQKLTSDVYERVFEHKERPEVLKGLVSMLNGSSVFLRNMRNISQNNDMFTQVEIETLEKVINETKEYHDTIIKSFAETPLYEPIKYKVRDIANKMALLDREVKYLVNKAKIWRPKPETTNNMENKTDQATNKTQLPNIESTSVPDPDTQSEQSNPENIEAEDKKLENILESNTTDATEDTLNLSNNDNSKTNNERNQDEKHQEL
ncbi:PREDICTED: hypoxia up-regulated protein 1 [Polistes canadensis]|uniref:hypoxia up-regulated protein 1 n=1 Tax=Polistes canadensis TaxID=91411 RepID=UPI000718B322|nr:PREDICTED: hypoxia up-regulated protein 1 [Polistes canadensis]XP_014608025.1 PREDICTED: hypoxia up-regulated protein 1 [Polistes canadensis]